MAIVDIYENRISAFDLVCPGFTPSDTLLFNISGSSSGSSVIVCAEHLPFVVSGTFSGSSALITTACATFTYSVTGAPGVGGTGDCFGRSTHSYFNNVSTTLLAGNDGVGSCKTWLPFIIDFSSASLTGHKAAILSATLQVTAALSSSLTTKLKIGCDNAELLSAGGTWPTFPTNYNTLNARIMTTNRYENTNFPSWVANTDYNYDITTAVQEVLGDYSTWTDGSALGVIIADYGSLSGHYRSMYAKYGQTGSTPSAYYPKLTIVYTQG